MVTQFLQENIFNSPIFFVFLIIVVVILIYIFSIRPFQTPNYIEEGRSDVFTNKSKKKSKKNDIVVDTLKSSGNTKKRSEIKANEVRKRSVDKPQTIIEKAPKLEVKISKPLDKNDETTEGWTEVLSPKERQKRSRQVTVESDMRDKIKKREPKSPKTKSLGNKQENSDSKTKQADKKSSSEANNSKECEISREIPEEVKNVSCVSPEKSHTEISEVDSKSNKSPSSSDKVSKKNQSKKKDLINKEPTGFEIAAFEIPKSDSPASSKVKSVEDEEDEVVDLLVNYKKKEAANRLKESSSSTDSLIEGFEIVDTSCDREEDDDEEPTPSPSSGASRRKNKKMKKKEITYATTVKKAADEENKEETIREPNPSVDTEAQDWCQVSDVKKKKKPRRID